MRKFSCLYLLLIASTFVFAIPPEIFWPTSNNSYKPGNQTPSFCSINYRRSGSSSVSQPASQSFNNKLNIESAAPSVLKIYPNPAKSQVTVYFPTTTFSEKVSMSLQNLMGQEVKRVMLYSSSATISLTGIAPGLYLYRVWDQDQIIKTGKLIIE